MMDHGKKELDLPLVLSRPHPAIQIPGDSKTYAHFQLCGYLVCLSPGNARQQQFSLLYWCDQTCTGALLLLAIM